MNQVRIDYWCRLDGEVPNECFFILPGLYEIDEGGEWECRARADFWDCAPFNGRYAVAVGGVAAKVI